MKNTETYQSETIEDKIISIMITAVGLYILGAFIFCCSFAYIILK